jgi:hypothetical protein
VRALETGIGLAAQSAANAASWRRRSMFWPAVTSSVAACPVPTPTRVRLIGAASATSCALLVEQLDLAVELGDAACERPQGGLGRLLGLAEPSRVGAQAFAQSRASALGLARRQLSAQILGSGDDQAAERVQRGAARLDGAVARDPQLADRLNDPAGVLRDHGPV